MTAEQRVDFATLQRHQHCTADKCEAPGIPDLTECCLIERQRAAWLPELLRLGLIGQAAELKRRRVADIVAEVREAHETAVKMMRAKGYCAAEMPNSNVTCDLRAGHNGPHESPDGFGHGVDVWPNEVER
jgi:hypothetical protein